MKALTLIIMACLTLPLHAMEYHTLSNSQKTLSVAPSSLIEVVGFTNWAATNNGDIPLVEFTLANGDVITGALAAASRIPESNNPYPLPILGQKFTNAVQGRIYIPSSQNLEGVSITLKITPAAEIDSAGPKTVLVIPEGSTGDYDVVIESSGDMVTWTPMHSQGVTGSGPQQFFRTRIIKR